MAQQLDLVRTLERFREELEGDVESTRRTFVLSILERWQDDQQLTEGSRRLARDLLRRFAHA